MTDSKQRILEDFLERVWNQGDIEAVDDYLASGYTIHHDPFDPWEGQTLDREGFKERVRVSRAPVPDQRFIVQETFEKADRVTITWLWEGTHQGEVAGFPPTGETLRMSGATVYHFDGDRICGHWQIADRLSIFQQLQARAAATA